MAAPVHIRGPADLARLRPRSRETWERVNEAVALARRDNLYPATAARRAGVSLSSWRRYAPETLEVGARGRLEVTRADRRYTGEMHVTSVQGDVVLAVRGSRQRTLVAEHANAVRTYLRSGDERVLEPFRGVRVAGVELAADPGDLDWFARAGELDWLSLYEGRAA